MHRVLLCGGQTELVAEVRAQHQSPNARRDRRDRTNAAPPNPAATKVTAIGTHGPPPRRRTGDESSGATSAPSFGSLDDTGSCAASFDSATAEASPCSMLRGVGSPTMVVTPLTLGAGTLELSADGATESVPRLGVLLEPVVPSRVLLAPALAGRVEGEAGCRGAAAREAGATDR